MSALTRPAIREGHRRLLADLRELLEPITSADPPPDGETLRAAVALLRHGVLPFARREEEALLAAGGPLEDAALEHAFLAGEIDRLGREVRRLDALPAGPTPERAAGLAAIRRLAYRIEAVLEVHLLKEEEAEVAPDPPAAAAPPEAHAARSTLTAAEVRAFLRGHTWATLSTVGGGQPYAVPVSYAFDGGSFYLATGPGRKARNLEECARVCLTVAEVAGPEDWCSVVATGEVRPVDGVLETMRALRLLARARGGSPGRADLGRLARARVYRLEPSEVSGRAVGGSAPRAAERSPLTATP